MQTWKRIKQALDLWGRVSSAAAIPSVVFGGLVWITAAIVRGGVLRFLLTVGGGLAITFGLALALRDRRIGRATDLGVVVDGLRIVPLTKDGVPGWRVFRVHLTNSGSLGEFRARAAWVGSGRMDSDFHPLAWGMDLAESQRLAHTQSAWVNLITDFDRQPELAYLVLPSEHGQSGSRSPVERNLGLQVEITKDDQDGVHRFGVAFDLGDGRLSLRLDDAVLVQ